MPKRARVRAESTSLPAPTVRNTRLDSLPREILVHALDNLSHDDIKAISIVNSAIRSCISPVLFRSVKAVSTRAAWYSWNRRTWTKRYAQIQLFLDLQRENGAMIRHLTLPLCAINRDAAFNLLTDLACELDSLCITLPKTDWLFPLLICMRTSNKLRDNLSATLVNLEIQVRADEDVSTVLAQLPAMICLKELSIRTIGPPDSDGVGVVEIAQEGTPDTPTFSPSDHARFPELLVLRLNLSWEQSECFIDVLSQTPKLEALDLLPYDGMECWSLHDASAQDIKRLTPNLAALRTGQLFYTHTPCLITQGVLDLYIEPRSRSPSLGDLENLLNVADSALCSITMTGDPNSGVMCEPRTAYEQLDATNADFADCQADISPLIKTGLRRLRELVQITSVPENSSRWPPTPKMCDCTEPEFFGSIIREYVADDHALLHIRQRICLSRNRSIWVDAFSYNEMDVPPGIVRLFLRQAGVEWDVYKGGRGLALPQAVWDLLDDWKNGG